MRMGRLIICTIHTGRRIWHQSHDASAGKELYGDLMRRIYVRGYCFNLNKMPRSSLIEVGAQTNTVAEAKNAMVPLGAILYKVLIAQE